MLIPSYVLTIFELRTMISVELVLNARDKIWMTAVNQSTVQPEQSIEEVKRGFYTSVKNEKSML